MSFMENGNALYMTKEEAERLLDKTSLLSMNALLLRMVDIAARRSRPPISEFRVGAAGLGKNGAVYFGVNLEFLGTPLTNSIHAEQFLIVNALHHGESEITTVATNAVPCGHCRQFLSELHNNATLKLALNLNGELRDITLPEIFPLRFKPQDVLGENEAALMRPAEPFNLRFTLRSELEFQFLHEIPSFQHVAIEALNQARESYAPYSHCPSGICIVTRNGERFGGRCIENCAFNPSILPLQSAIIHAISEGKLQSYEEITHAVMVELTGNPKVSYAQATAMTLQAIAPAAILKVLKAETHDSTDKTGDRR